MSSKKYIDFPPGIYDTSKIFLQADPVTGALEKVNLPSIAPSSNTIANFTSANNSGINPQTIATLPIPANTLANDGDVLLIYAVVQFLTATGTKAFELAMNSSQLITRSNASAATHTTYLTLMRSNGTTFIKNGYILQGTSIFTTIGPATQTFDPTIVNNININILNGLANDIKYWFAYATLLLQ